MTGPGADLGAVISSALWRRRVYVGYTLAYLACTSTRVFLDAAPITGPDPLLEVLAVVDQLLTRTLAVLEHLGPAIATLAAANVVVHRGRRRASTRPSTTAGPPA